MSEFDQDDQLDTEEGIEEELTENEGDLDMGMDADGNPIAGGPNDPSDEDGFSTEEETF